MLENTGLRRQNLHMLSEIFLICKASYVKIGQFITNLETSPQYFRLPYEIRVIYIAFY